MVTIETRGGLKWTYHIEVPDDTKSLSLAAKSEALYRWRQEMKTASVTAEEVERFEFEQ